MIEQAHDFPLSFRSLRLLLQREHLSVHHLHRVESAVLFRAAEAAEVDTADVAAPDLAHKAKVAEREVRL